MHVPTLDDRWLVTNAPEDDYRGMRRAGAGRARVVGRDCNDRPLRLRDTTGPMQREALYAEFSRAGFLVIKDQWILEMMARYYFVEFPDPESAAVSA